MSQIEPVTIFGPPFPELPVADAERAQQRYRDALGFKIGSLYPGNEIGTASRRDTAIFFQRRSEPFEPAVHWMFAADVEATYLLRTGHAWAHGHVTTGGRETRPPWVRRRGSRMVGEGLG